MTNEEKIKYMRIATGVVGMSFNELGVDILVSIYELTMEKGGEASLRDMAKIEMEAKDRELKRLAAQKSHEQKT